MHGSCQSENPNDFNCKDFGTQRRWGTSPENRRNTAPPHRHAVSFIDITVIPGAANKENAAVS
jgi:hypothetical protein